MPDAYDLTMTREHGGTAYVTVSHLGRWGGTGDTFAGAEGSTPAEALRALADLFDANDQYPDPDPDN